MYCSAMSITSLPSRMIHQGMSLRWLASSAGFGPQKLRNSSQVAGWSKPPPRVCVAMVTPAATRELPLLRVLVADVVVVVEILARLDQPVLDGGLLGLLAAQHLGVVDAEVAHAALDPYLVDVAHALDGAVGQPGLGARELLGSRRP